jgi:hypothetical protein
MSIKIKDVALQDLLVMPTERQITDSGQMIVPVAFARIGTQDYSAGQLGLTDRAPEEIVTLHRKEADVFDEKSMASFRSVPVTVGHPMADGKSVNVTSANAAELQKGMLEGMPVRDEDNLTGSIVITDEATIQLIQDGVEELSAGYSCDIVADEDGNLCQTNIRANHIAIVAKGRAGSTCRIADEAEEVALSVKLADSVALHDALEAKYDVAIAKVAKLEAAIEDSAAATDKLVVELTDVILKAKDLCDIDTFSGLSVLEIKKAVVADALKLDLADKSDAYAEARWDILLEDGVIETPMSKVLRKEAASLTDVAVVNTYVDPVLAARNAAISRNK